MNNHAGWTAADFENLLKGQWLVPTAVGWHAEDIAIFLSDRGRGVPRLFVAMDVDTWLRGTGNTGIYARWSDTHDYLKKHYANYCGAVVQRYIPELPPDFPQFLVEDSYEALISLGAEARRRFNGKAVAITGTVGKSSTKDMLSAVLSSAGSVVTTQGNNNSRTGVSLTLACAGVNPDYVVIEAAISALWMRNGGVGLRIKPHICIITEVGITQVRENNRTLQDIARHKARVCNGIIPGGYAIVNRDIAEYEQVHQDAVRYGANVISYGFHPLADVPVTWFVSDMKGSDIGICLQGETIRYRLDEPGKGIATNSVAVMIAARLLGLEAAQIGKQLAAFRNHRRKMQISSLPVPAGGSVTLIDDSYSAEYLSMLNAFDFAARQAAEKGGRLIAVLARIINLNDKAEEVHRSLAEPLLAAGFHQVFVHGEEMRYLHEILPPARAGGHFMQAGAMVESVLKTLREGDIVLVKGDPYESDFGEVVKLLHEQTQAPRPVQSCATLLVNLSTGETPVARHEEDTLTPRHLSQLLLALLCAQRLQEGKLALVERVPVREIAAEVLQQGPSLGLKKGDSLTVKSLVQAMLIENARDAAINLGEYLFGDNQTAREGIQKQADAIGMTRTRLHSVSGRLRDGQCTTLQDIALMIRHFYQHYPHLLHWFAESEMTFGDKLYRKTTNMQMDGRAGYSYTSGGSPRWGFAIQRIGKQVWLACVAGASDAFHLDYQLDKLLAQAEGTETSVTEEQDDRTVSLDKKAAVFTLIGDTYFGEWYTRQRQQKGIDDALQHHGYDYSFQGLRPLIARSDYTIANFEAALGTATTQSLQGRKPFCLIGDPERSAAALRRAGVDAVALANNHSMDAGEAGLKQTLAAFRQQDIVSFGSGLNARQASAPLVISVGGKVFKFYSAYWFRLYMEQDCAFYAQPRRAGAACISGELIEQLRAEKARDNPATTIVLAHWGMDYRWTGEQQRALAKRLTRAGADLIIGSGPHMLGEIERLGDAWVVYSIGNGVFNSNGEYRQRNVPPYGFIVRLQVGGEQPKLCLHPVLLDNQQTFWQPRPVGPAEFEQVMTILAERGVDFSPSSGIATGAESGVITLPLGPQFGGDLAVVRKKVTCRPQHDEEAII